MKGFIKIIFLIIVSFNQCKKETTPTVPFLNIKLVTAGGMICYGAISNDGGSSIVERGFKWKTEQEDNYQNNKVAFDNGTNSFETRITGLSPNTTYYVKAYATNNEGSGFSEEKVITTSRNGTFTDNRDGKTYKWVEIGNQIWMAENLSYIPYVSSFLDDNGIFVYNYKGSSVDEAIKTVEFKTYGCLYSLEISLDVCPDGWHLPSQEEWDELDIFTGKTNQGNLLKDTGWGDRYSNNLTLFSALPAGYHFHEYNPYINIDTYFWYLGNSTFFWSSSIWFDNAFAPGLDSYHKEIINSTFSKDYGLSVRCIKDN